MKRIKRIVTAAVTAALIFCMTLSCSLAENGTPVLSAEDQFTGRDLEQAPDLSGAKTVSVTDGQDVHLTAGGVYVLSGEASGMTIYVEAGEDEKVQLVLDGLTVTNTDFPVIYVKTADKVFITTSGDSSLSVTGTFTTDGDTGTDGVIQRHGLPHHQLHRQRHRRQGRSQDHRRHLQHHRVLQGH